MACNYSGSTAQRHKKAEDTALGKAVLLFTKRMQGKIGWNHHVMTSELSFFKRGCADQHGFKANFLEMLKRSTRALIASSDITSFHFVKYK